MSLYKKSIRHDAMKSIVTSQDARFVVFRVSKNSMSYTPVWDYENAREVFEAVPLGPGVEIFLWSKGFDKRPYLTKKRTNIP